MNSKQKEKLAYEWIIKNGAAAFDFRKENIKLYNGGLFQDMNTNFAELWMGDLDSTIRYLKKMKKFLNSLGIRTDRDITDWTLQKKAKSITEIRKPKMSWAEVMVKGGRK